MPLDKNNCPQPERVNSKKFLDNYDAIFGVECSKCGHKYMPLKKDKDETSICPDCIETSNGQIIKYE